MDILKKIAGFLASLSTAIWLLLALLCALLYGSIIMPMREEFQGLHMMPLFRWLSDNPAGITWWLWAAIAVLSLLTANTLFCSVDSVIKKSGARNLLLVLSPQVIHIGFLFVLLGHLLSSYGSYRASGFVAEGASLPLPDNETVVFDRISADVGPSGYVTDWAAEIRYLKDGSPVRSNVIGPNSPSFRNGYGIYIKTVEFRQSPVALVELSRDPGAVWALVGGMLFLAGMSTLLALRIKRERPSA
ncbi:MAG: hypothetical protein M0Z60_15170 [Nitrospiraceae bacterium]|nr:hypothetical protein [Nitrospiraceae bacterium]